MYITLHNMNENQGKHIGDKGFQVESIHVPIYQYMWCNMQMSFIIELRIKYQKTY